MTNKEYLDYLKITGMNTNDIKYEIDLRFSRVNINIINLIESNKVEIKDVCEGLRVRKVKIDKALYLIGLLMIHTNDEDDFKFLLEEVLKHKIEREYDLEKYVDSMISDLSMNLYYSFGDINTILKSGEDW